MGMASRRQVVPALVLATVFIRVGGFPRAGAQSNIDFANLRLETVKVADGLYVLMGGPAQGNIAVSVGEDGVLLVDSMYAPMHQKIVDAVRALSSRPIRYVVNTHLHGDHTAGNAAMAALGATIVSHQNMRTRLAAASPRPAAAALPALTYTDSLTLHFNGEEIEIYHPAPAHTDGDSIIYFRKANVVHVGDIPASLRYPNIGVDDGGTVDGMMAAARQLRTIVRPDTRIIPGHLGPVVGFAEVDQQLAMFAAVRDRIAAAIHAGKTQAEVVASKPTAFSRRSPSSDWWNGKAIAGAIRPWDACSPRRPMCRSTPWAPGSRSSTRCGRSCGTPCAKAHHATNRR
jgi:cyclase